MDVEFELSTTDRFGGLLLRKQDLSKSNAYYGKIHPTEAGEVDARRDEEKAKAEAKAKVEAQAKSKAEADAKAKTEADAKAKAAAAPVLA